MRIFVALYIALAAIFLIVLPANSHPIDWKSENLEVLDHCFDFSKFRNPEEVNPALLAIVCAYIQGYGAVWIHHSDYRLLASDGGPIGSMFTSFIPYDVSYHHNGGALDGRFDDYTDMSRCEIYETFRDRAIHFSDYLYEIGMIGRMGFGLYVDQNNPFFHIDMRSLPDNDSALWSRKGTGYVTLDEGVELLNQKLEPCGA